MKVEEVVSVRAQDVRVGHLVKRYGEWWRVTSIEREPRYDGSDRVTWRVAHETEDRRDVFQTVAHETWAGRR